MLFEATLRELQRDTAGGEIRVDPHPLRNSATLVTLHAMSMISERIEPGSWTSPYADISDVQKSERVAALARLGIAALDGLPNAECPGALMPPTPANEERRRSHCPPLVFRAVMVALPRTGGSYWPRNFDEREKYAGRDVCSVRVIVRLLAPNGHVESSADLIFEATASGWQFLERRALLIIE
jgi:hypothetical protein